MIDIKLIRENPELVKENIKKKFQDEKLPMVDEVAEFDKEVRAVKAKVDALRSDRNKMSKEIGLLMRDGKKEEAEQVKAKVKEMGDEMETLEKREAELNEEIKKRMYVIPNIIDPSVPIGKDDSENQEIEKFGEPFVPDFEVPYHTDILEKVDGLDIDSAGKLSLIHI